MLDFDRENPLRAVESLAPRDLPAALSYMALAIGWLSVSYNVDVAKLAELGNALREMFDEGFDALPPASA